MTRTHESTETPSVGVTDDTPDAPPVEAVLFDLDEPLVTYARDGADELAALLDRVAAPARGGAPPAEGER
jgi:predicted HAD superfamily phosphohydrolase YqeG